MTLCTQEEMNKIISDIEAQSPALKKWIQPLKLLPLKYQELAMIKLAVNLRRKP